MSDASINPRICELLRFTKVHNRHREALTRATGEHFNIFKILGISRREVTTHSPMLAELLNPNGAHGQGAAFLRLFLAEFKLESFAAEGATVAMEFNTGKVTEDSGGRIDILIKDRTGATIVIENKIDAGDQAKQLERYRKECPKAHLFYLTLDRHKPGNISEAKLKSIDCQCISYSAEILSWLRACRKDAAALPGVRETIAQYIHLIEEMTNQSTNLLMSQELIDTIIGDKDSYLAYASMLKVQGNIKQALVARVNTQLATLGQELGLETLEKFAGHGKPGDNFFFTTAAMKAQNLRFGLRCSDSDYRNVGFGFAYLDASLKSQWDVAVFKAAFDEQFYSNDFWHAFAIWNHRRNWDAETMAAIISDEFAPDLEALIRKLATVAAATGQS